MTINLNKNFTDTIRDLENSLYEKEKCIMNLNLKYRIIQEQIYQYQVKRSDIKKEIHHLTTVINEMLGKKGLDIFKVEKNDIQRNTILVNLQLISNAIRSLNSKI